MDAEEFRRVVEQLKDRVYSYAVYMLRDRHEAQDVAQEALVRLWQHRAKVTGDGAARAWLLRTAHNLCVDRLRARSARPAADLEGVEISLSAGAAGPEQRALASELGRQIGAALDALSPRDRSILVMREIEGLPYAEIAAAVDLPLGTLKAALHRARERLRRKLVDAGVTP